MFHAWCLSPEDPQLVAYPARPGLSPEINTSARVACFCFFSRCIYLGFSGPINVLCKHPPLFVTS